MGKTMEKTVLGSLGKMIAYLYAFENNSAESKNTDESEEGELLESCPYVSKKSKERLAKSTDGIFLLIGTQRIRAQMLDR